MAHQQIPVPKSAAVNAWLEGLTEDYVPMPALNAQPAFRTTAPANMQRMPKTTSLDLSNGSSATTLGKRCWDANEEEDNLANLFPAQSGRTRLPSKQKSPKEPHRNSQAPKPGQLKTMIQQAGSKKRRIHTEDDVTTEQKADDDDVISIKESEIVRYDANSSDNEGFYQARNIPGRYEPMAPQAFANEGFRADPLDAWDPNMVRGANATVQNPVNPMRDHVEPRACDCPTCTGLNPADPIEDHWTARPRRSETHTPELPNYQPARPEQGARHMRPQYQAPVVLRAPEVFDVLPESWTTDFSWRDQDMFTASYYDPLYSPGPVQTIAPGYYQQSTTAYDVQRGMTQYTTATMAHAGGIEITTNYGLYNGTPETFNTTSQRYVPTAPFHAAGPTYDMGATYAATDPEHYLEVAEAVNGLFGGMVDHSIAGIEGAVEALYGHTERGWMI